MAGMPDEVFDEGTIDRRVPSRYVSGRGSVASSAVQGERCGIAHTGLQDHTPRACGSSSAFQPIKNRHTQPEAAQLWHGIHFLDLYSLGAMATETTTAGSTSAAIAHQEPSVRGPVQLGISLDRVSIAVALDLLVVQSFH